MVGAFILLVAIKAVPNVVLQKVPGNGLCRSFGAMTAQGNCLAVYGAQLGAWLVGLGTSIINRKLRLHWKRRLLLLTQLSAIL